MSGPAPSGPEATGPDTGRGPDTGPKNRERLARYIQLVLLGAGGMGAVYRAYDPQLERMVAIKLMHDRSPAFVARFRREARAMARLSHPRVVQIYDFGEDPETGSPYIVMELVSGQSLTALLTRRGRLQPDEVERILRQAAEGLAAAHAQGIIHRDIKPANLVLDERGDLKLVDFGIARMEEGAALTRQNSLIGTPHYMAPELIAGQPADPRTDIYALGLTAFHLLTGKLPFEADSVVAVAMKQLNEELPSLESEAPAAPPALRRLILRMTAKDPSGRVASCDEVLAALRRPGADATAPQAPRPWSDRRGPILAACAGLLALGSAGLLLSRRPRPVTPHREPAALASADLAPLADSASSKSPVSGGRPRLAVLPFSNLSAAPDLDFLAEGLSETVVTALLGLPVQLTERTQVQGAIAEIDFGQTRYVDADTRAALGRIAGAQWAIQGGYQHSAGQIRVTARLVQIDTGEILDTLSITRDRAAIFSLQDAVATEVRARLQRRLLTPSR